MSWTTIGTIGALNGVGTAIEGYDNRGNHFILNLSLKKTNTL